MRTIRQAEDLAFPVEVREKKKTLYERLWIAIVLFLILLSYFGCLQTYGNIQKSSALTIIFSDVCPGGREVRNILDAEEESGQTGKVCFFREAGFVTAEEPSFGRRTKVCLNDIQGNAVLFDPRIGGFYNEDQDGCVIDRETAEDLFGSGEAVGREIRIQGKTYQVRSVMEWKQRLILIHSDDKAAVYSRMFFDCQVENKTDAAGQFLMRYGLSGIQADGSLITAAAKAAVCILPLVIFMDLFLFAGKQKKAAENRLEKWIWTSGCALMIVVLLYFIIRYCRIPSDWIPGKWSDFSFWARRIGEEKEKILYFLAISRTAKETEILYYAICTIVRGILSAVFYFWWTILRNRNKILEKSNKRVEDGAGYVL